jgi:hypothetical protein
MEFYTDIKARVLGSASAAADLSALHLLLQKEHTELLEFVAARDAECVAMACDGIGTDDAFLIQILCNRTRAQLQLADTYFRKNSSGNKTMRDRVKGETSGNYGSFMCALLQSGDAVNAGNLRQAFDGLGCDKAAVNELYTTLSNAELLGMRRAYEGLTDSNLSDRLKSELSGEHEVAMLCYAMLCHAIFYFMLTHYILSLPSISANAYST